MARDAFSADMSQVIKFTNQLRKFKEKAIPFATRQTLNEAAFATRLEAQQNIRDKLNVRSKFTERSVFVERSKTLKISNQSSSTGSVQDYMAEVEQGGIRRGENGGAVAIPTGAASGEMGTRKRKRLVRPNNRMRNIRLGMSSVNVRGKRVEVRSLEQEIFLRVRAAVEAGNKFVILDTRSKKGLYRIRGRGRVTQGGRVKGIKMRMLYDLSKKQVPITKNPWLEPAFNKIIKQVPAIHIKNLEHQLDRL